MGFAITVAPEGVPEAERDSPVNASPATLFTVTVRLNLTSRESSNLFLAGDVLLSWPSEDALPCRSAALWDAETEALASSIPFTRTSMFASEVARLSGGLKIRYRQAELANRVAEMLRRQLLEAGIGEEA